MKSIFLVLLMGLSFNLFADSYYVADTAGVGVGADEALAITDIVKSAVGETKNNEVVADKAAATFQLKTKLLKLGKAYVLKMEKVQGAKVVYASEIKAASIEEMDLVAKRLTKAVVGQTSVKKEATVQDVTETETKAGTARREAFSHWYVGFGPGRGYNLDTGTDVQFAWALARVWQITTSNAALKLFYEGSKNFNMVGIGGHYYLSDRNNSPFLILDTGYGFSHVTTNSIRDGYAHGFAVGGGAGWAFFRTSAVGLDIQAHYGQLLASNSLGLPSFLSFKLGLNF